MRIDGTGPGDGERIERTDRAPAKAHAFRAALKTAKRRDDQDDAAAGQAAQQRAELRQAPSERGAPPANACASDAVEPTDAKAADQPDVSTAQSAGAIANQAIGSTVQIAADGVRHAASAGPVTDDQVGAARPVKAQVAANGADVMSPASAESAARAALTASIAATLGLATGSAPRARDADPQPTTQAHQALDPMLAAGLGAPVAAPAPPPVPPAPAPAAKDDSPVSALLAAAVSRAVGSFAAAPAGPQAQAPDPGAGPAATALPGGLDQLVNLTPLEQAVHALIGEMTDHARPHDEPPGADADLAPFHALASAHLAAHGAEPAAIEPATAAPVRAAAPVATPELPVNPNPSHLHLVVDDGPERVVVTVAMRGNDVHVAMRSADDTTTTALARNAASLDHAMRARGLALGELTAEREPADRQRQPPRDAEPRDRKDPRAPRFTLEEKP